MPSWKFDLMLKDYVENNSQRVGNFKWIDCQRPAESVEHIPEDDMIYFVQVIYMLGSRLPFIFHWISIFREKSVSLTIGLAGL